MQNKFQNFRSEVNKEIIIQTYTVKQITENKWEFWDNKTVDKFREER